MYMYNVCSFLHSTIHTHPIKFHAVQSCIYACTCIMRQLVCSTCSTCVVMRNALLFLLSFLQINYNQHVSREERGRDVKYLLIQILKYETMHALIMQQKLDSLYEQK